MATTRRLITTSSLWEILLKQKQGSYVVFMPLPGKKNIERGIALQDTHTSRTQKEDNGLQKCKRTKQAQTLSIISPVKLTAVKSGENTHFPAYELETGL